MHILATFATLCYQTQWPPNHSCTTRGQNVPFWAIFGHPPPFWPFWAILGHFGHFWPFLALFGPPGPPGAHFRTRIPPPIPENIPAHIVNEKKTPAHIPEEENSRRTLRAQCPKTFSRRTLRANSPRTTRAQIRRPNSAHKFGAQIPRKFSPRTFVHKFPGRKFCRNFSDEKLSRKICTMPKKYSLIKKI